ncbi:restriction endonuclease subunit S [Allochromatium humboldtianum]|uniref:Restriction endonuclease subunit S n=1 Tax=Allochromatium humboldtianum TaxID=504901 RepID=A0A850R884_9GAMM|nr:restriction endonuclease subunit S [Allochromatium humboldtianum]NVZ09538.1 restriction endonuclease subunit S [Allochromatium humboldtianum]
MKNWKDVPFDELLVESRDGEWGLSQPEVGHTEAVVVRGTDFSSINNPGQNLPHRWIKDHLVERKRLQPGDIIFEMAGGTSTQSTGRSALLKPGVFERNAPLPILCASFSRHLRLDASKFCPEFVYYFLQTLHRSGYMGVFHTQHTGVARFQYSSFKKHTTLKIPDLLVQRKIAAILTAYDDLIDINNRRIAMLEKMAEEIYREWFVRMRFPGHKNTKFFKGVPEGWKEVELREVCDEASKSTKSGEHLSDRFYLPLDLLASRQMLPIDHYDYTSAQSSLALFEKGDILFGAMRPYQHKIIVAPFNGVTRTTMFVIRPKKDYLHAYCYLNLFQDSSVEYATLICNGSDRPYVVWNKAMERMKVFLPQKEILINFEKIVAPILTSIHDFYFIQRKLAETRDLLLPRLISGKLSVEDLDIQFPLSMRDDSEADDRLDKTP